MPHTLNLPKDGKQYGNALVIALSRILTVFTPVNATVKTSQSVFQFWPVMLPCHLHNSVPLASSAWNVIEVHPGLSWFIVVSYNPIPSNLCRSTTLVNVTVPPVARPVPSWYVSG